MAEENDQRPDADTTPVQADTSSPRVYLAEDLFQGAKEIIIKYGAASYRLRITKSGKLILNK